MKQQIMIQTRLGLPIKRQRIDYPQVNYVDKRGTQWIELNRGCKRRCVFCYADPSYKTFPVPEIRSNIVHVIGEGFLYDSQIKEKIILCGMQRVNNKVVHYGLSQGIDYRLLTENIAQLLSENRFGIINNKGKWYKGIRFAWDWGMEQEPDMKRTTELLESVGYNRKYMSVFVLVNWKIPYEICLQKLEKLKDWGLKIDDCFWDTTKKAKIPFFWTQKQLIDFRRIARKHNQLILFNGYDPEWNRKGDKK